MKKTWVFLLLACFVLLGASACTNNENKQILAEINSGMDAFSEVENGFIKFNITSLALDSEQGKTKESAELLFRKDDNRFEYIMKIDQNTNDVFIIKLIDGKMTQYLQSEKEEKSAEFSEDFVIEKKTVKDKNSMLVIMKMFISNKPNNKYIESIKTIKDDELTGYKLNSNNKFLEEYNQKMPKCVDKAVNAYDELQLSETVYWLNDEGLLVKLNQHTLKTTKYLGTETVYDIAMECELINYNKNEFEKI
ncbi:MAG: hypothetical protein PHN47_06995 [Clostridia bacterium]|nr:hypothetical protein [Clostridia bacterium]